MRRCCRALVWRRFLVTFHLQTTVCFFVIVTKDDGIAQPNDFTPMSAINQFEVYCLCLYVDNPNNCVGDDEALTR